MSKKNLKLSLSNIKKHIKSVISEQPNRQGGQTPPPRGQIRVDPKLTWEQNVYRFEQKFGRPLTAIEKQTLDKTLTIMKASASLNQGQQGGQGGGGRTTTPKVNNNDLTGDDKGEGVNFYFKPEEDILAASATIDKVVKSGTGVDVYVSGDWTLENTYYHWDPSTNIFQGFNKSTHKPLSWTSNGKTYTQTYYNKEFSAALKQKLSSLAPTSQPNDDIDFTSGNVNEQTSPSKYGTVTDDMNIIKEKMVGKPVRFFKDRELKTPAFDGKNFTFVNVQRDKTYGDNFNIYFKELGNEPLIFNCDKNGFYMRSKQQYVFNQTLVKYLSTALCKTTVNDDGTLKSVPGVKYAKNNTQGSPNQTNNQTLAENKKIKNQKTNNMKVRKVIRLTESELKRYINKVIAEQSTPTTSPIIPKDIPRTEGSMTQLRTLIGKTIKIVCDRTQMGCIITDVSQDESGTAYIDVKNTYNPKLKTIKFDPNKYTINFVDDWINQNNLGDIQKGEFYDWLKNNVKPRYRKYDFNSQNTKSPIKNNDNKMLSEQINPDYSKGTHDIDKRGDTYLPLAQKLAKQLKDMGFKFNGKSRFTSTFDGYHVIVEFNNQGVNIFKQLEKNTGMPNMQAPLTIPFEKLTEMNFMKYITDYVHGTKS
jgi:hypothetical protein